MSKLDCTMSKWLNFLFYSCLHVFYLFLMVHNSNRSSQQIRHLLEMIERFPRVNPSANEDSELDIPKLFRQIRSRYKALCAVLGVRPTLRGGERTLPHGEVQDHCGSSRDLGNIDNAQRVWPIQKTSTKTPSQIQAEDFSF